MLLTMLDSSAFLFCFFSSSLLLLLLFLIRRFSSTSSSSSGHGRKLPLPPGTLGWPYVGETFQLYSQNPNIFFASKQKRYGSIFKTHILGCPCVMMSSPKAAKFVLVTSAHLFKPTFPASKERMLGKDAIFFHQGDYHAKLRKLVLRAFMPQSIRSIVSDVESIALQSLRSWDGRSINAFQEMKTVSIFTLTWSLFRFPLSLFGRKPKNY